MSRVTTDTSVHICVYAHTRKGTISPLNYFYSRNVFCLVRNVQ